MIMNTVTDHTDNGHENNILLPKICDKRVLLNTLAVPLISFTMVEKLVTMLSIASFSYIGVASTTNSSNLKEDAYRN